MTALDTGTEDLRAEIDDGVAVITMNRPDRRAAFSHAMVSARGWSWPRWRPTKRLGASCSPAAGGAFSAGGDVKNMAASPTDRGDGAGRSLDALIHRQRLNQRATSGRLWSMPKADDRRHRGARGRGWPVTGAGLRSALREYSGAVLTTAFARVAFAGDYGGQHGFSLGW